MQPKNESEFKKAIRAFSVKEGPCKSCYNWCECPEPCNLYLEWAYDLCNGNSTEEIRS